MDTNIAEYEEIEEHASTCHSNNGDLDLTGEVFPELWEIEMEVLQVENNLDAFNNFKEQSFVHDSDILEDYQDSEPEMAEVVSKKQILQENNDKETFPLLWELELEILNCNESIGKQNLLESFEKTDWVDSVMSSEYLEENYSNRSKTLAKNVKTRYNTNNRKMCEAMCKKEGPYLSISSNEAQVNLTQNVQDTFANMNIA